jgi:hypothetical protein
MSKHLLRITWKCKHNIRSCTYELREAFTDPIVFFNDAGKCCNCTVVYLSGPDKYTIVHKIKCCVNDWCVVFVCYNTSGWKTSKMLPLYWVCVTWINEYELLVEWHRQQRPYVFRERPAPIPLSNLKRTCLGLNPGLRTEGLRVLHHIIRNSYVWGEPCICYRTTGTVTCNTSVCDERLHYCWFTEHIQYCGFTEHMFLLYHCQHSIELHFLERTLHSLNSFV